MYVFNGIIHVWACSGKNIIEVPWEVCSEQSVPILKSRKAHYFQLYSVMQHADCVYMILLCFGTTLNPLNGRIMQKHGIISELFSTSPQSVSAFYVIINFTFLIRLVNDNGHHRQRPCLMEYAFEKETSSYLHFYCSLLRYYTTQIKFCITKFLPNFISTISF